MLKNLRFSPTRYSTKSTIFVAHTQSTVLWLRYFGCLRSRFSMGPIHSSKCVAAFESVSFVLQNCRLTCIFQLQKAAIEVQKLSWHIKPLAYTDQMNYCSITPPDHADKNLCDELNEKNSPRLEPKCLVAFHSVSFIHQNITAHAIHMRLVGKFIVRPILYAMY